ncbi:pyrroloquinoline quinone biosynthesis protein PqqB [Pseudorhodoplanes sinuspersici]|uniref:pyrroloquinoline quinone biosynthesis protein PqqB n=1 Tax=Pseudorhodoplanes sinuspersici TaxID=1235591 RepID=UPI000A321134|nr:pyrroloquinoline quinone biosynthesis protein PqqB [Pseudorhodoplanes sinuspersici]
MTALVLGAAAGGGFPQWNCRCPVCALAWDGDPRVQPRTQASIAVSVDGQRWLLCNASPDLRAQILANAALQPKAPLRHSPIAAVLLTGAEIDQCSGLLTLRERQTFLLYATVATHSAVLDNPMFSVLHQDDVLRRVVSPGESFAPLGDMAVEIFTVPGKMPLYLEGKNPQIEESAVNIGVEIESGGKRLIFIPGAAALTPSIRERLSRADAVLFDGTLFTDDEMIMTGTGTKTGMRMGHMPIDGENGSLAALSPLAARRIFIHINNTNPVLIEGSPERRRVEDAGFEIAYDGMEIEL